MDTHLLNITLCDQNLPKLPKPTATQVRFISPNTNPCHNTNIVSTIQAKPKQILSKSVTLATRPTSTQQFRQGRVRELALSCGILDLKNMQRDKLTSDPKYFETCLTSLYSYIPYHTDKHKPFTTATPE
jgi:hypothetical protein